MSSAYRYLPNYSVADYQAWEGDWELWDGIPVSMSPSPYGAHQYLGTRLITLLSAAIEKSRCAAVVLYEIDWIVSNNTVVRPDVSVVCGGVPDQHVEQVPAVVAEILSASTEKRDRTSKLDLYREQGVPYYLIIDPIGKVLTAFELDDKREYLEIELTDELTLSVCDRCKLVVPVKELFV